MWKEMIGETGLGPSKPNVRMVGGALRDGKLPERCYYRGARLEPGQAQDERLVLRETT